MSSQTIKTNNDNDMLQGKINLRIESIAHLEEVTVLELFGGEGVLWNEVKKQTGKKIEILSIDKNKYKRLQLQGDNIKFIDSLNLSIFNVIDIDAWGSPYKQMDMIFNKGYFGIIHCTFIQTMMGCLSKDMLLSLGYTDKMIDKIPSIFNKNGIHKFKLYLANKGIKEINIISKQRKNYLWFHLNKA
jgi:hypothetical protein